MEHEEVFLISLYRSPFLTPKPNLKNRSPLRLPPHPQSCCPCQISWKAQESQGKPVLSLSAGWRLTGSSLWTERQRTQLELPYITSLGSRRARGEAAGVFPGSSFYSVPPHCPYPGMLTVVTLALANSPRKHPGQGSGPWRRRGDGLGGWRSYSVTRVFSPGTLSNSVYLSE